MMPGPVDPIDIYSQLGGNSSVIIPFQNPTDRKVMVDVVMKERLLSRSGKCSVINCKDQIPLCKLPRIISAFPSHRPNRLVYTGHQSPSLPNNRSRAGVKIRIFKLFRVIWREQFLILDASSIGLFVFDFVLFLCFFRSRKMGNVKIPF